MIITNVRVRMDNLAGGELIIYEGRLYQLIKATYLTHLRRWTLILASDGEVKTVEVDTPSGAAALMVTRVILSRKIA